MNWKVLNRHAQLELAKVLSIEKLSNDKFKRYVCLFYYIGTKGLKGKYQVPVVTFNIQM